MAYNQGGKGNAQSNNGCLTLLAIIVLAVFIFDCVNGGRTFSIIGNAIARRSLNGAAGEQASSTSASQPAPNSLDDATSQEAPSNEAYDSFYYRQLDSNSDRILYAAMQTCFAEQKESIDVAADIDMPSSQTLTRILEAVLADHPEYFWVKSCRATVTTHGWLQSTSTTLFPTYTCTPDERSARQNEIDAIVDPVCSSLQNLDNYDKVRGVYDFLIDHTTYDLAYTDSSMYGLFHNGRSVCAGYARATQYMLNKLGIETIYVSGTASGSTSLYQTTGQHAWNIVQVDGSWYQLDTTWGDPAFADGHQERRYDYFLVTSADISGDHTEDGSWNYPSCTATENNYFVHEGCFFSSYSPAQLQSLISPILYTGEKLSVRYADAASYQEALGSLFKQGDLNMIVKRITGGSHGPGRFYHITNDTMYTITLWFEWA